MKKFIFFTLLAVITASCERDFYKLVYYDKEGYGYVFYKSTREPAPNAKVSVYFGGFPAYTYGTTTHEDYYYTDSTGFYSFKFLKSKGGESPLVFSLSAWDEETRCSACCINIYYRDIQDFKNLKNFKIDTLFINH